MYIKKRRYQGLSLGKLRVCVLFFSSYKDTSRIGLGPT